MQKKYDKQQQHQYLSQQEQEQWFRKRRLQREQQDIEDATSLLHSIRNPYLPSNLAGKFHQESPHAYRARMRILDSIPSLDMPQRKIALKKVKGEKVAASSVAEQKPKRLPMEEAMSVSALHRETGQEPLFTPGITAPAPSAPRRRGRPKKSAPPAFLESGAVTGAARSGGGGGGNVFYRQLRSRTRAPQDYDAKLREALERSLRQF